MLSYVYRYDPSTFEMVPGRITAPVMVRSCGHYVIDKNFHDNRLQKFFLELFWGVRGTGFFRIGNETVRLLPNTVFFYFPGDTHDIEVENSPFEYYWVGIDGPNVSSVISQFHIEQRLYEVDAAPVQEFDLLRQQIMETSLRSEYMAGATAYRILSMAMSGRSAMNSTFEAFVKIVHKRMGDASLSIDTIAKELGIHRFTLSKIVLKNCNMSPSAYIQTIRMQQVLVRLRTTNCPIKQIAYEAGFSTPNYFARAVRRCFGMSPGELRQRFHDDEENT